MPYYTGFTTVNSNKPQTANLSAGIDGGTGSVVEPIIYGKKFVLVDEKLIITDLINALNIRQGEKVGQPDYGTTLWDFIFEPNTIDNQLELETEIKRVANLDPRLIVNSINSYAFENGILVEMEIAVAPFNVPQFLNVFFNQTTNQAVLR